MRGVEDLRRQLPVANAGIGYRPTAHARYPAGQMLSTLSSRAKHAIYCKRAFFARPGPASDSTAWRMNANMASLFGIMRKMNEEYEREGRL